eukprot:TRINITY_DN4188_c0_g1_i2.p2 TRINITY_DN4188_c0_g1~~TRINITY_DN4188_c0_g1_i2.p2  ORF type:complete len:210 (-),score=73.51 TRINITY_DN4188_c0_g1_i2:57-686(-)
MEMRTNSIAWNPMEAFNFVAANEDSNLYTFDMRKLDRALMVHTDHVAAVLDVDFSPTGREFVSGSYDHTLRIFQYNQPRSREVYWGRRVQRVFGVAFSGDSKFILSGSDDTNIRVWKAQASAPLKTLTPREKQNLSYSNKLKKKFSAMPEVKRISKQRRIPRLIQTATHKRRIHKASAHRKLENVVKHNKPGKINLKPERKKHIVSQVE